MTIIVVCRFKNPPPTADSLIDLRHVCCDLFFQFLDEEDHLQAIFAVNFSGFHRFHHFWVWDQIGKVWKRRYPYMFWGGRVRWSFFPSRKTSFRWHCTQGTEKTLKANPNQNWETSTILSDETLNHTNFYSASLYWSKPEQVIPQVASGSCSVRVCNLQLDDSPSIPSVPLIWGNDSQIVLPNYREVYCYLLITVSHILIHHSLLSITLWLPVFGRPIYPPRPCWLVTRQLPAPALAWVSCMVWLSCMVMSQRIVIRMNMTIDIGHYRTM